MDATLKPESGGLVRLAALGVLFGLASSVVDSTLTEVALVAAGFAGAGHLWRRVVKPTLRLATTLEDLPDWCKKVDDRLTGLEHQIREAIHPNAKHRENGRTSSRTLDE